MTSRSAHATIKGYFYQFDHTIARLLEATTSQSSVMVEGIEDIDLDDGENSAFIQCKYYEGTEYNHSIIKDAIIAMLNHFHARGCPDDQKFKYQIYGHYQSGQNKLSSTFDLNFLKENFLTYTKKEKKTEEKSTENPKETHQVMQQVTHKVFDELKVDDNQLTSFLSLLKIDINALTYDEQQKRVSELLISQIPICTSDDANIFYYPNAINVIRRLAIQPDESNRSITKAKFISQVNNKDVVFNLWLRDKFGQDYYAKLIKQKYFKFPKTTKIPKASRIFAIDMTGEFNLPKAIALLSKIGKTLSHKEHKNTPDTDRFCPYILLYGLQSQDLAALKNNLWQQGVKFVDGYPFQGANFIPATITANPTKENLLQLKFITTVEQLSIVAAQITGSNIEVFDFFKSSQLDATALPKGISHHPIKINSTYFINEVI